MCVCVCVFVCVCLCVRTRSGWCVHRKKERKKRIRYDRMKKAGNIFTKSFFSCFFYGRYYMKVLSKFPA